VFIILSERLGTVGASFDFEAAKTKGYNIDALIAGGFIGKDSPIEAPKTSKVTPKTDKTKD
jgi:hypothetical protein